MASSIWKYTLAAEFNDIAMPQGAQILNVAGQHGKPCVWALVDTHAPVATRRLVLIATGSEFTRDNDEPYVGTALLAGGDIVLHVFDAGELPSDAA